ncbi:MAG: GNAT family N-acetyltransferase [Deltaproteobacteria bacterium]|nr:GNAT family N-acetyltransferase [Deltaproteobacteria bacterium]MBW2150350.1 GNAT family N-acetyltransferase [Deltaproteobacteria bacterium]
MKKKILIRKLTAEDADAISRIYSSITQKPAKMDFRRIIEEQVPKNENACYVAEYEGTVIGYMISYVLSGAFGLEKSAWIALMGVDPKYMGQGIGDRLARRIFKFYRDSGIKDIYTSVRWDSTDLLSFFKTLGFDRSNFINLRKKL